MIFTKDFLKAFNILFLFSILLMGLTTWMEATNNLHYSVSEPNSDTRILWNSFLRFLIFLSYWLAIAYATKEYKGVGIVLLIKTALLSYYTYSYLSDGFQRSFWLALTTSIGLYLLFGFIHFKDKRCLYLLVIYFVLRGLGAGMNSEGFYDFLNGVLRIFRLRGLMEIEIPLSETSYRPVNLFRIIMYRLRTPLEFMIFWFVYSKIISGRKLDFSLRTINLNAGLDKLSYSTMYWTFRLMLMMSAFGIVSYLRYAFNSSGRIEIVFNLLCYTAGIYILSSMYRNFLSAWFVSKGKYPGWTYFALNIPFINFFAWLSSLFQKVKDIESPRTQPVQLEGAEPLPPMSKLDQLKKKFKNSSQNQSIQTLIFLFIGLSAMVQVAELLQKKQLTFVMPTIIVSSIILTIVFAVWYFRDSKAAYIQFGIIVFALVVTGALYIEGGISFGVVFGMINIIFYYALFHFDHLIFIDKDPNDPTRGL